MMSLSLSVDEFPVFSFNSKHWAEASMVDTNSLTSNNAIEACRIPIPRFSFWFSSYFHLLYPNKKQFKQLSIVWIPKLYLLLFRKLQPRLFSGDCFPLMLIASSFRLFLGYLFFSFHWISKTNFSVSSQISIAFLEKFNWLCNASSSFSFLFSQFLKTTNTNLTAFSDFVFVNRTFVVGEVASWLVISSPQVAMVQRYCKLPLLCIKIALCDWFTYTFCIYTRKITSLFLAFSLWNGQNALIVQRTILSLGVILRRL